MTLGKKQNIFKNEMVVDATVDVRAGALQFVCLQPCSHITQTEGLKITKLGWILTPCKHEICSRKFISL